MVKNIIETGIPRVKQYMSETDRALRIDEVAEHLGVVYTTAFNLLDLMYEFEILDKVKRGRNHYYFLKDVYSDEQIKAMLPPEKPPHIPKPRHQRRRRGWYDEMLDEFMESGHRLVEITVENRNISHFKCMLKKKIKERELMDQVDVSRVDEWIYLEKVE